MYTEGFDDLEEAQEESHRTYGASSDMDRLLRENDRLKKSIEKEKFFNKLLDQEIQELKSSMPGHVNYQSEYWSGKKRSFQRSILYFIDHFTRNGDVYRVRNLLR